MNRAASNLFFALLPLTALGCGLQLDAETDPSINSCSASSECGAEGACVSLQSGETRCVATSADLGSVIVEVRPSGGSVSLVVFDAQNVVGENSNGMLQNLDLELPASVGVSVSVQAPENLSAACSVDGSLPVDVTMIRQVEFGAFASRYEIPSTAMLDVDQATSFVASVPPGTYDMYLRPHALDGCTEALPAPELVTNVTVEAGEDFVFSSEGMATAAELSGKLTVPANLNSDVIEGWVLEVLDPTYGYVISNQLALQAPGVGATEIPISGFSYHAIDNALLRLRDLDGNLSVHWALDALDLNSDGVVELDLRDLVAQPSPFSASVVDSAGAPVLSAGVIIQSTALTGSANQNANYRVDTRTDGEGKISVSLLQGTYAVTVVPDGPGDAAYFGEWVVAGPDEQEFGQGKAFELLVQPVLTGSISDPLGNALVDAPIAVGPSQSTSTSYFTRALVDPEPVARQFSTSTNLDGSFEVSVDPGEVDVAVQMPPESGFPWSVLPSFKVDAADLKPQLDLGDVQLRYPVILQGHVADGGVAVPYAQVRAWVRGDAGKGALIQIGATITDADGGYVLLLPPGITITEPAPAQPSGNGE